MKDVDLTRFETAIGRFVIVLVLVAVLAIALSFL